jgi:hypothetical protein
VGDEAECLSTTFEGKVSAGDSYRRARKLMALARRISQQKNKQLIGKRLQVLVEGPSEESELVMVGRHRGQAPEIDGTVFLSGELVTPGTLVDVTVSQATDYDLLGHLRTGAPAAFRRVIRRHAGHARLGRPQDAPHRLSRTAPAELHRQNCSSAPHQRARRSARPIVPSCSTKRVARSRAQFSVLLAPPSGPRSDESAGTSIWTLPLSVSPSRYQTAT